VKTLSEELRFVDGKELTVGELYYGTYVVKVGTKGQTLVVVEEALLRPLQLPHTGGAVEKDGGIAGLGDVHGAP
jgi:hypothetical protein